MGENQQVRTRIAPSPTGKMHIGTARTALFNKLFALHHGGMYCVRIEDTDKERSTPENVDFIKEAFAWMGLEPDEGYVFQSGNINAHKAAAQKLLSAGKAYEDEGAVRFRIPEGHTHWADLVQGDITYDNNTLEDFVILRSDGTPTYHLGVVVDDMDMAITHVIRGDDHINNTPKQILLHHALGNPAPQFAHIPLIHGPDGGKLSKRHGAASVQEYRDMGYLPSALNHYLMQLSWLPGDDMTMRTLEQAGIEFNLKDVKKGAASFDAAKLASVNAHYLKHMENEQLLAMLQPFLKGKLSATVEERLLRGLDPLKTRAKTLLDVLDGAQIYLNNPPFALEDTACTALNDGLPHLKKLYKDFAESAWDAELLHEIVKDYVEDHELKFPAVGTPLRVALVGQTKGPGIVDIMMALGREESLSRLANSV